MLRFQIIDCFGDCIRKFASLKEAKAFKKSKKITKLHWFCIGFISNYAFNFLIILITGEKLDYWILFLRKMI